MSIESDHNATAHKAEQSLQTADIARDAAIISDGDSTLFGWFHHTHASDTRDCVAVICNPLGYEYVHSHRSLRHLADQLASNGIPALRFDYHGTGDSPGDDFDENRLRTWLGNIKAAITYARTLSGCHQICLIGLRMGGTLAALLAQECPIDFLVLWHPCNSGRQYLREMKAIATAANTAGELPDGATEAAGFVTSADTATQLQQIKLPQVQPLVTQRVLVIGRDDMAEDTSLADHFNSVGVHADYLQIPGYTGMMMEAQFTVIPSVAIAKICGWLRDYCPRKPHAGHWASMHPPATVTTHYRTETESIEIQELPCRFGNKQQLFGLLSYRENSTREKPAADDRPVIVLLNAGSVHHVGPNRLYVNLARALSASGFTCLRMDLEGLGDSVAQQAHVRENHPYPSDATADVAGALEFLNSYLGPCRFVLLGLCSGAHTAFHAGADLDRFDIAEIMLINPLTFQWVEGMTLATTQHFQNVAYYKKSARNLKSWLKLLRGKVNVFHLSNVALSQLKVIMRSHLHSLLEILLDRSSTQLSADLKRLLERKRRMSLIVAAHDPGYDLLMAGAKHRAGKAIRSGSIKLHFIAGADHTFTRHQHRQTLIAYVCKHMQSQWPGVATKTGAPNQN